MIITNGGYPNLSRNSYNASFASAASAYGLNVDPIINTEEWRFQSYSFCGQDCSLLTINSFGDTLNDRAVTEYMGVIYNGSCNDIVTIPQSAYSKLVSTPPTALTERFYECSPDPQDAINDAIGIASGNTATLIPIGFIFILPLIYFWLSLTGNTRPKEEYTSEEKEDMRDKLVLYLLRARDGKVRSMRSDSAILLLSNELQHLEGAVSGYPDSDDSESGDDAVDITENIDNGNYVKVDDTQSETGKNLEIESNISTPCRYNANLARNAPSPVLLSPAKSNTDVANVSSPALNSPLYSSASLARSVSQPSSSDQSNANVVRSVSSPGRSCGGVARHVSEDKIHFSGKGV